MIGIGIDTGGTYTDAVVYDMEEKKILCSGKSLTTKSELENGITAALDMLDPEYVKQAEMLALSTTLATNACLEDKGSRAKILMIGMSPETMDNLETVYASYGFRDLSQLVFIDGKPEHIFQEPEEPDWEDLKKRVPEEFRSCASAGVAQIYPQADGGKLEKKAKKILEEQLKIPVTTAYDMFDELIAGVSKETVTILMHVRIEQKAEREEVAKVTGTNKDDSVKKGPTRRKEAKVYPNDPCPCGSGKKYKQCCGRKA